MPAALHKQFICWSQSVPVSVPWRFAGNLDKHWEGFSLFHRRVHFQAMPREGEKEIGLVFQSLSIQNSY